MAFSVKGLGVVAAFIMNLVLARTLGAEQSGYFFLGFTLVTFLGAVTRCGFDNVILRHSAIAHAGSDMASVRLVFFRGAAVAFVASSSVAFFIWIGSDWIASSIFNKPDFGPVLESISPAIVTLALLWLLAQSFRSLGYVSLSIFAMGVAANIMLVIAVSFIEFSGGADAALTYSIGSVLVLAAFLVLWHLKTLGHPQEWASSVSLRNMLLSAWPLWIVLLMSQLIQWTGQFVGGAYLLPEEIAQLAVAQRTAMLVSFILMAVNMVVAPRFAALYAAGNMDGLRDMALTAVRLMALGATPVVAVMLIFPDFLMGLFGEGFAGGILLLQVLAIGQFVNVLTGSVGNLLTMSGHEQDLRNTLLIVAPISVVVTLLLVPLYGALGAAVSTALAVGAQNLLAVYWVKRRLGFNTLVVWRSEAI